MTTKEQRSKKIRKNWVQFDTLCYGTGWDEGDLKNPQILAEHSRDSYSRRQHPSGILKRYTASAVSAIKGAYLG